MKAPLIFWFTICLICIFSSCEKGKCYYHNEVPCGKVYGSVKKVTDTVYNVMNGEITYPSQTYEYHFDSLSRLVEIQHCIYNIDRNEAGEEIGVSINQWKAVKYRYDRDGRKVQCVTKTNMYQNEMECSISMLQRLIAQDGNNEKWETTVSVDQHEIEWIAETYWQYEEDRTIMDGTDSDTQIKRHTVCIFDDQGNVVERHHTTDEGEMSSTVYLYNENNQLVEEKRVLPNPEVTYYKIDEFDNEGNWLKRTSFDENEVAQHITRRRIEYRI